jgi:tRNA(His) 5'-end guanylyltransferase
MHQGVMQAGEVFSGARLAADTWTAIRLDGRAFTKFTAGGRFAKPYDAEFRDAMVDAAAALLEDFGGIYAATHSDEISVVFAPAWEQFGRRVEKIVSVAAGLVSAAFTHAVRQPAHFDARVWQGAEAGDAVAYFRWRQEDAARCALNAWCHWARLQVEGKDRLARRRLLLEHGIDFDELPGWQRRGVGLYWRAHEKAGYNPLTHASVSATRRAVERDFDLPTGQDYAALLAGLFEHAAAEAVHAS